MRARAIVLALGYGIAPWWLYEPEPHYAPMTYRGHLAMNLRYAWRWARRRESDADRRFEREVNGADAR